MLHIRAADVSFSLTVWQLLETTFGTRHRYVMAMITVVDTPAIVTTVFNRRFAARALHVVQPDWSCTWTIPSSNHPPAVVPEIDNLTKLAPHNGPYEIYSNGTDNNNVVRYIKMAKKLLPEPSSQQKNHQNAFTARVLTRTPLESLQCAWFAERGLIHTYIHT